MLNWYALNCKPHCERLVSVGLASRGIGAYLPLWQPSLHLTRVTRPHPFFPGYLFAHADLETVGLSALQYLPGVRRLVFYGDQPAPIPETAVLAIERRLAEMHKCIVDGVGQPLTKGDRVVITAGPFQGYEGIFDRRLSPEDRVRLFIDFSKKLTPLEIEREYVRRKGAASFVIFSRDAARAR
jgi:transcriptional antiterminator RfaH